MKSFTSYQYYHRLSHQPSMAKEDEDINMNVNSIYYICSNCNGSGYVNWSVQPTFNERGGMSITQCCNTILCNVCADNVQDELKKGSLKYSCIYGTLCPNRK